MIAQRPDGTVLAKAHLGFRLNGPAYKRVKGPGYLTVLKGEGKIITEARNLDMEKWQVALIEPGTNFRLEGSMQTLLMAAEVDDPNSLVVK